MRSRTSKESSNPETLKARFRAHAQRRFPRPTDDPELSNLHAELAEYDANIAGYASRMVEGESFRWEVLGPDPRIEKRIRQLLRKKPGQADLIRAYQEEYERIQELIKVAKEFRRGRAR